MVGSFKNDRGLDHSDYESHCMGTFTPANLLVEKDCVGVLFCLYDDVVCFTYLALCCVYFFKDVLYNCTVHDTHRGSHIIMNHD